MNRFNKSRVQSTICDLPYPGADFNQRFQALCSGSQQVIIGGNSSAFCQKNDGGSAKSKIALFMAFFRRAGLLPIRVLSAEKPRSNDSDRSANLQIFIRGLQQDFCPITFV